MIGDIVLKRARKRVTSKLEESVTLRAVSERMGKARTGSARTGSARLRRVADARVSLAWFSLRVLEAIDRSRFGRFSLLGRQLGGPKRRI